MKTRATKQDNFICSFHKQAFSKLLSTLLISNMVFPSASYAQTYSFNGRIRDDDVIFINQKFEDKNYAQDTLTNYKIHQDISKINRDVAKAIVLRAWNDPNNQKLKEAYKFSNINSLYREVLADQEKIVADYRRSRKNSFSAADLAKLGGIVATAALASKGFLVTTPLALIGLVGTDIKFSGSELKKDSYQFYKQIDKIVTEKFSNESSLANYLYASSDDAAKAFSLYYDQYEKLYLEDLRAGYPLNLKYGESPESRQQHLAASKEDIKFTDEMAKRAQKSADSAQHTANSTKRELSATNKEVEEMNERLAQQRVESNVEAEVTRLYALQRGIGQATEEIYSSSISMLSHIKDEKVQKALVTIDAARKVYNGLQKTSDPINAFLGHDPKLEKLFEDTLSAIQGKNPDSVNKAFSSIKNLDKVSHAKLQVLGQIAGVFTMASAAFGAVSALASIGQPSADQVIMSMLTQISEQIADLQKSVFDMHGDMLEEFAGLRDALHSMEERILEQVLATEKRLTQHVDKRYVQGDIKSDITEAYRNLSTNINKSTDAILQTLHRRELKHDLDLNLTTSPMEARNALAKSVHDSIQSVAPGRIGQVGPSIDPQYVESTLKIIEQKSEKAKNNNEESIRNQHLAQGLQTLDGFYLNRLFEPQKTKLDRSISSASHSDIVDSATLSALPYQQNAHGEGSLIGFSNEVNFSHLPTDEMYLAHMLVDHGFDKMLRDNSDMVGFIKNFSDANNARALFNINNKLYNEALERRGTEVSLNQHPTVPLTTIPPATERLIQAIVNSSKEKVPEELYHRAKRQDEGFIRSDHAGTCKDMECSNLQCHNPPVGSLSVFQLLPKADIKHLEAFASKNKQLAEDSFQPAYLSFLKALSYYNDRYQEVIEAQKTLTDTVVISQGLILDSKRDKDGHMSIESPFDLYSGDPLEVWDKHTKARANSEEVREGILKDRFPGTDGRVDIPSDVAAWGKSHFFINQLNSALPSLGFHDSYMKSHEAYFAGALSNSLPPNGWFLRNIDEDIRKISSVKAFSLEETIAAASGWKKDHSDPYQSQYRPLFAADYKASLEIPTHTEAMIEMLAKDSPASEQSKSNIRRLKAEERHEFPEKDYRNLIQVAVANSPDYMVTGGTKLAIRFDADRQPQHRNELDETQSKIASDTLASLIKNPNAYKVLKDYKKTTPELKEQIPDLMKSYFIAVEKTVSKELAKTLVTALPEPTDTQKAFHQLSYNEKMANAHRDYYKKLIELERARRSMLAFAGKNFAGTNTINKKLHDLIKGLPSATSIQQASDRYSNLVYKKHQLMEKHPGKSLSEIQNFENQSIFLSEAKKLSKYSVNSSVSSAFKKIVTDLEPLAKSTNAKDLENAEILLASLIQNRNLASINSSTSDQITDSELNILSTSYLNILESRNAIVELQSMTSHAEAKPFEVSLEGWMKRQQNSKIEDMGRWLLSDEAKNMEVSPYYLSSSPSLEKSLKELEELIKQTGDCFWQLESKSQGRIKNIEKTVKEIREEQQKKEVEDKDPNSTLWNKTLNPFKIYSRERSQTLL